MENGQVVEPQHPQQDKRWKPNSVLGESLGIFFLQVYRLRNQKIHFETLGLVALFYRIYKTYRTRTIWGQGFWNPKSLSPYSGFFLRRSSFRRLFFMNRFCCCDAGEQALTRVTSPAGKQHEWCSQLGNLATYKVGPVTSHKCSYNLYINDLISGNWGL